MVVRFDVPDAIQWHEGMLLAPQHFQQFARRQEALVAHHVFAAAPFSWGIQNLTFDLGLLAAGRLRVTCLEAIFPDGLAISLSHDALDNETLELSLSEHMDAFVGGELSVYLAITAQGVSASSVGGHSRYRSVPGGLVEDDVSSAIAIDLPCLRPRLALFAGNKPSGLYVSFRLAVIESHNGVFRLGGYLPPSLSLPSQGELWQRIGRLVAQMREKAAFLAKQTASPSSQLEDRLNYLELRDRLRSMVVALPELEALLHTPDVHPLSLYMALCRLLGYVSLLRPGSLPAVPPGYFHEDIQHVFTLLLIQLEGAVSEVSQSYQERKFEFRKGAFVMLMDPAWFKGRLVIGVRGQSEKDILAWMQGAIIGSEELGASFRERRILGAPRSRIDSADEYGLRGGVSHTLFSIEPTPASIIPGKPLVISNPAENAVVQRPVEIVLFLKG